MVAKRNIKDYSNARKWKFLKALKDSLKRRLDRNRMILQRKEMRRFIKGQQLEEEQRILAERKQLRGCERK